MGDRGVGRGVDRGFWKEVKRNLKNRGGDRGVARGHRRFQPVMLLLAEHVETLLAGVLHVVHIAEAACIEQVDFGVAAADF